MNNILEVNSLIDWVSNRSERYAYDSKNEKELRYLFSGSYQVFSKGELIWQGSQPYRAVEKYNSL